MKIAIFDYVGTTPLKALGLTGSFWTIHIDTIIYTWYAMLALLVIILMTRFFLLRKEQGLFALGAEKLLGAFIHLCNESFPVFNFNYFAFITSLFFFTFFACIIGLIPFLKEATDDLNTTFALGLTSFVYVQYQKIKAHGFVAFLSEFIQPFFLLAPINIVGELAKIASMSFRLFGNILGESIIFTMLLQLVDTYKLYYIYFVGISLCISLIMKKITFLRTYKRLVKFSNTLIFIMFLLTWAQMFFGIFGGLIQSLVITMLTVTYLSMGTQTAASHEEQTISPDEKQKVEVYL